MNIPSPLVQQVLDVSEVSKMHEEEFICTSCLSFDWLCTRIKFGVTSRCKCVRAESNIYAHVVPNGNDYGRSVPQHHSVKQT